MGLFDKIKSIINIDNANSGKIGNTGNIQKFREDNKIFYDSGIVREIFTSEEYCICSVAETAYVMFNYFSTNDGYGGLMLHPTLVDMFAKNKKRFESFISRIDEESIDRNLFVLSESNFQRLKELKEKYSIQQSNCIDYQLEAQIKAKYHSM